MVDPVGEEEQATELSLRPRRLEDFVGQAKLKERLGISIDAAGTLAGASNDGSASCGDSGLSPDIYYRLQAPYDGTLFVTSCGTHDLGGVDSGIDTVISLHSYCPVTSGNQLDCNDLKPAARGAFP